MSGSMRGRVIRGMGAHSMGMLITIGTQLASLPLYLSVWDAERYGVWLMLSALPAYLSMADIGMVTAAGNQVTMAMGAGRRDVANKVFHSAQLFMALVCGTVALVLVPLVLFLPWSAPVTPDQRHALLLLMLGVLVAFLAGLSDQMFRATHRAATGALMGNAIRLVEWAGWMAGLLLSGSFTAVALGGLILRLVLSLFAMGMAAQGDHGLSWGFSSARASAMREMAKPAMAFMAFPLANALAIQSITLLVGTLLGPAAVAIFNTYRTLARTATQATAIFSFSLWPEFSRLHGQGDEVTLRRLAWRSTGLGALQALLVSLVMYALAPWLLQIWTHARIGFDAPVFGLLAAYAFTVGAWHVPRVVLMATNRHTTLALWSIAASGLGFGLTAWLAPHMGLVGTGLAMLIAEIFVASIGLWLVFRSLSPTGVSTGAML